jgi:hypothetical protein
MEACIWTKFSIRETFCMRVSHEWKSVLSVSASEDCANSVHTNTLDMSGDNKNPSDLYATMNLELFPRLIYRVFLWLNSVLSDECRRYCFLWRNAASSNISHSWLEGLPLCVSFGITPRFYSEGLYAPPPNLLNPQHGGMLLVDYPKRICQHIRGLSFLSHKTFILFRFNNKELGSRLFMDYWLMLYPLQIFVM